MSTDTLWSTISHLNNYEMNERSMGRMQVVPECKHPGSAPLSLICFSFVMPSGEGLTGLCPLSVTLLFRAATEHYPGAGQKLRVAALSQMSGPEFML